jgi:hypothetical protein
MGRCGGLRMRGSEDSVTSIFSVPSWSSVCSGAYHALNSEFSFAKILFPTSSNFGVASPLWINVVIFWTGRYFSKTFPVVCRTFE